MTQNADVDKYEYSGHGIGFDRRTSFSFPGNGFGQNVKDILVLGKGPIQGFEHTLSAEKMYSINFTVRKKIFFFESALQWNK